MKVVLLRNGLCTEHLPIKLRCKIVVVADMTCLFKGEFR